MGWFIEVLGLLKRSILSLEEMKSYTKYIYIIAGSLLTENSNQEISKMLLQAYDLTMVKFPRANVCRFRELEARYRNHRDFV